MNIRERIQTIDYLIEQINQNNLDDLTYNPSTLPTLKHETLKEGISIIIPFYKSAQYIDRLIPSLQSIHTTNVHYELLFIVNGEETITIKETKALTEALTHTQLNCTILQSKQGASHARNIGIQQAQYSHTLFLDSDDTLSSNILSLLSNYLKPSDVLVFGIHDITNQKSDNGQNIIHQELSKYKGNYVTDYLKIIKVLSMNGAKVIPTVYLKSLYYNETLTSGEDVVLMMQILAYFTPNIYVVPNDGAYYERHIVDNSVSRKQASYEFNVLERYQVIEQLAKILNTTDDSALRSAIMNRMNAQAGFVNRYLENNRHDYTKVIKQFEQLHSEYIPYSFINQGLEQTLYIGYCFTPYTDTSGIVLAKRIRERGVPGDVISNDMSSVRDVDYTLKDLSLPYLSHLYEITSKPSFSNWTLMEKFVTAGLKKVKNKRYKEVYSRVLWPASHFLAFEVKKQHNIKWIAEFSDPVLYDIHNKARVSKMMSKQLKKQLKQAPSIWQPYIDDNVFNVTELLAFIYADELIFTNNNQLLTMIARFKEEEIKTLIQSKSTIQPHPTLDESFYTIDETLIEYSNDYFNVGYFGNFYATRGLEEVKQLLNNPKLISHVNVLSKPLKVHIYTSEPSKVKVELNEAGVLQQTEVNGYLPYFEFLNATTKLDALIVMDAHTQGIKEMNPYLPSKYSDYNGSNKPVIAFVEEGSPLEKIENKNLIKIKIESGQRDTK